MVKLCCGATKDVGNVKGLHEVTMSWIEACSLREAGLLQMAQHQPLERFTSRLGRPDSALLLRGGSEVARLCQTRT